MTKKQLRETVRRTIKQELNETKYSVVGKNGYVKVQNLKKGDILNTTNLEVINVSSGAKTPAGKLEVTLRNDKNELITAIWNKDTVVKLKNKTEEDIIPTSNIKEELKKYIDTQSTFDIVKRDGETIKNVKFMSNGEWYKDNEKGGRQIGGKIPDGAKVIKTPVKENAPAPSKPKETPGPAVAPGKPSTDKPKPRRPLGNPNVKPAPKATMNEADMLAKIVKRFKSKKPVQESESPKTWENGYKEGYNEGFKDASKGKSNKFSK